MNVHWELDIVALVKTVAFITLAVHLGWSWWLLAAIVLFVEVEFE